MSLGVLGAVLGMSVMGGGGENEWERIPDFAKERSVIRLLGRKEYVSLPMPLGFHVPPNLGRRAVEFMLGGTEKTDARQLGDLPMVMVDTFDPMGSAENLGQIISPTETDPAVALAQNREWTGRPIHREDLSSFEPTPGPARTKDSASTFSKVVADLLNRLTAAPSFDLARSAGRRKRSTSWSAS